MLAEIHKQELIKRLQTGINKMQGFGKRPDNGAGAGLYPFSEAFPERIFPTGSLHEFLSDDLASSASTSGFISAVSSKIMKPGGRCVWIGSGKVTFPLGLKHFGLEPDCIIFIEALKPKEVLWAIEEALKCEALTHVVGQISEFGFAESRRLQLAVERSGVTGFIHRIRSRGKDSTACTARWRVTPIPSIALDDLPGIGRNAWQVDLLKVKNGRPRSWQVGWSRDGFISLPEKQVALPSMQQRNAG